MKFPYLSIEYYKIISLIYYYTVWFGTWLLFIELVLALSSLTHKHSVITTTICNIHIHIASYILLFPFPNLFLNPPLVSADIT